MLSSAISPQAWFEYGYQKFTGSAASDFRFIEGETPLSTSREVVLAMAIYLAVIFGGQRMMKSYKPFQLSVLFQIHNFFLTAVSLALFVIFAENVLPIVINDGVFNSICSASNFTQRLELLYYLNYLTKYYELLDTVFLVLRKKNIKFLHWYHHSMTALLCFTQLSARNTVAWVPITLNLGVHILMYYYYFLATFNIKVWWKKYITVFQIVQFVIDLVVIYFCLYTGISFVYFRYLPLYGNCSGELKSALFGAGLLSSYLLLFVEFFYNTYRSRSSATAKATKGKSE